VQSFGVKKQEPGIGRHVIVGVVAIVVALLLLFPLWKAVHPSDPAMSRSLGFAWTFSPPLPPTGTVLSVERDHLNDYLAFVLGVGALLFWWNEGRR
jgi:hypothetical protein